MPVKLERLKSAHSKSKLLKKIPVTFCHISENVLSFRIIKSKRKLRVVSEMTDILGERGRSMIFPALGTGHLVLIQILIGLSCSDETTFVDT